MTWKYILQALLSFLLALFAVIPELKANNSRNREIRKWQHSLILFLKKPLIRITSLIILFGLWYSITRNIETENNDATNRKLDKRDFVRDNKFQGFTTAMNKELKSMGYRYDSIKKTLVNIRDSIKKAPNPIADKPLLTTVLTIDSNIKNNDKLIIELRSAGGNIKKLHMLTSVAAIINDKTILLYNKHKAFANDESLGKEIVKTTYPFAFNNTQAVKGYVTYTHGYYLDMNNIKYNVENYYLTIKYPFHSGEFPKEKSQDVKDFFKSGKELIIKFKQLKNLHNLH